MLHPSLQAAHEQHAERRLIAYSHNEFKEFAYASF